MDTNRILVAIPFLLLILSFAVVTKELVLMDEAQFAITYPQYENTWGPGHPGYCIPLWILTNIFNPALTLKVVSFLAGLLTLYYTYQFTRKNLGETEGLVSLYLLLGLPLFWYHAVVGEVYMPTALGLILFIYFFFEKRPYAAGLSLGMAVAIQEAAGLIVFPFLYLLFKKSRLKKAVGPFLASGIPIVLGYGYLIQRHGFIRWARGVFPFRSWFLDVPYQSEVTSMSFMTRLVYNIKMTGLTINLVGFLALGSVFAYKKLNSEKKIIFKTLVLMLLPLFLYPLMPVTDAYPTLVIVYPFLAILGALGLTELGKRFKLNKNIIYTILALFVAMNFFVQPMSFLWTGANHPTFELVNRVEVLAGDSCVYSCLAGSGEEKFFKYYFPERKHCVEGFTEEYFVTSNCASDVEGEKEVVETMQFENVPYPWVAKDYTIYRVSS